MNPFELVNLIIETSIIFGQHFNVEKLNFENGKLLNCKIVYYNASTGQKNLSVGIILDNFVYKPETEIITRFAFYSFDYEKKEEIITKKIKDLMTFKKVMLNIALYQSSLIVGTTLTSIENMNKIEFNQFNIDTEDDIIDDFALKKAFGDYKFGDEA